MWPHTLQRNPSMLWPVILCTLINLVIENVDIAGYGHGSHIHPTPKMDYNTSYPFLPAFEYPHTHTILYTTQQFE